MRAWDVFAYELKRTLTRSSFVLTTLALPLLIIAVSVIAPSLASNAAPSNESLEALLIGTGTTGYVDQAGIIGERDPLAASWTRYPTEDAALAGLQSGAVGGFWVIPPDYMTTGEVRLVLESLEFSQINRGAIRQALRAAMAGAAGADADAIARLIDGARINVTLPPADAQAVSVDARILIVYVLAIGLLLALLTTSGYLIQGVLEEKETRLIELMLTTLRPFDLLFGKIAAYGIAGLVQIGAWMVGAFIALTLATSSAGSEVSGVLASLVNFSLPGETIALIILFFLLSYLMFAGFYGIVGALVTTMREAPAYALVLTLPALLPLYILPSLATTPDSPLAVALSLIPLTAPLTMPMRLIVSAVPPIEIVISLVGLLLLAVVLVAVAARVFRVNLLLAGTTPSLRDFARLLRG